MTCARTLSLGAYLLGALDPAERSEFEAHLATCDACRSELVRLAPLPGLLHRVRPEDFEDFDGVTDSWPADDPPLPVPTAVEPRVVAVRDVPEQPQRARRYGLMAAAAVVVAALCVGGVLGYQALRTPAAPQPVMVSWSATDSASGVRADVDLTDRAWGTEVAIRLHDVPPGKPCKLVVRDRYGNREIAGWWATGYAQGESIPGSTSIDLTKITRVEVVTDDDIVLVDVPAPS